MENKNHSCPHCGKELKYKNLLISVANFILDDLKAIQSEIVLNRAVVNNSIDDIDEKLSDDNPKIDKVTDMISMLDSVVSSLEETKQYEESYFKLQGRISAYTEVLNLMNNQIDK
jgi:hypothetical protein